MSTDPRLTAPFHPIDDSLKWQGNAQRLEIHEIFPELHATRTYADTPTKPKSASGFLRRAGN